MRPNDQFSYMKNNLVSQDTNNLIRLYLPIIGREAVSLYLYCLAFWDDGHQAYTFGHILNHLNMGMEVLKTSFERLSAIRSNFSVCFQRMNFSSITFTNDF